MRALVFGDWALVGEQVWQLGCTCTSPRRRKKKMNLTDEQMEKLKRFGKEKEIR